jgi:predicted Zn-dependent peptidase
MVLSGKVGKAEIELLDRHLGRAIPPGRRHLPAFPEPEPPPGRVHHLPMAQPTVQTALRIGRRMFARQHPDFAGMYVLNTVLGGYFGSRLMHNIREQKGYTYNIYSSLDTFLFDGYFYIGTEVGNAFLEPTVREVRAELDRLRRSPVPKGELEMVRSYLRGTFLTMLDGPFQVADLVRSLAVEGLPADFFGAFVERVHQVDSRELQRLANQYLRAEDLIELTVGERPV